MKELILLDYNENTHKVEQEERTRFLYNIICAMELPIDEFWDGELKLTANQRIHLREILSSYNVLVIEELDGHMQIYVEDELVAEWFPCTFVLKKDLREINPKKRLYLEMEVNTWSVFEEEE